MAKFGITGKLIVVFLVIGALPLLAGSYFGLQNAEDQLLNSAKRELIFSLEGGTRGLLSFIQIMNTKSQSLSNNPDLEKLTSEVNSGEAPVQELNDFLDSKKENESTTSEASIRELMFVNSNGKVVSSTVNEYIGQDVSKEDFFINGTKEITTSLDEDQIFSFSYVHMLTGAPVGDNEGVLILVFSFEELQSSIQGQEYRDLLRNASSDPEVFGNFQIGERTRIYLSDDNGKLTIPPIQAIRELGRDGLNLSVKGTLPYDSCIENSESVLDIYKNYNNEEVVGASLCTGSGSIFVAETPVEIALQPIEDFRNLTLIIVSVTLLLLIGTSAAFGYYMTKPINDLTNAIDKISKGNMNVSIKGKNRKDEIGKLARAFDRTLVSLKLAMKKEGFLNKDKN